MGEDNYSLGSRVFHMIRENILSGKYERDEELKEKSIGEELGVSRTPVREALRQLELEGLVKNIPNKGAVVVGVSEQDVEDIYEIRIRTEGLAARLCAEKITKTLMRSEAVWKDCVLSGLRRISRKNSWMSWRKIFFCRTFMQQRATQNRWLSWTISSTRFYIPQVAAGNYGMCFPIFITMPSVSGKSLFPIRTGQWIQIMNTAGLWRH